MFDDGDHRVIEAIRLPLWGSVVASDGVVPWMLVDGCGIPVKPVEVFLRDFVAQGRSQNSVRSYALALLRWWRFLVAVGVVWDRASPAEVRDFVLWLGQASKPVAAVRVASRVTAGQVNQMTRKRQLGDGYGPATVRHSNAVLRTFYEFWLERGEGPLTNPVVLARAGKGRAHAHHNPLEVFRAEGRLRYNPRLPKRKPRAMPDEQWETLFAALGRNRDRAILALGVSTGVRAAELLGMRGADLEWLYLWLACVLDTSLCSMSVEQAAIDAGVVEPMFRASTMAVPGERELAYLTWRLAGHTDSGGKIMEVGVIGHSESETDLADRVAEEVRAWSEEHRNRTVQFEISQTGVSDPKARRFFLDRPHHGLTVIWR